MSKNIIIIVLDSVGIGAMPDAVRYKDKGTNTLKHIYEMNNGLDIVNLCKLGMGRIVDINCSENTVKGSYGKMQEIAPGKDTTSGHWELTGVRLDFTFPTYPDGFPEEIIEKFRQVTGYDIIGNYPKSGTVILEELGKEHLETGKLIVYTSADSVFQIAAHEEVVPVEELYKICEKSRKILTGRNSVSRVIARPFKGKPGNFIRNNADRKDFSLDPLKETLLDILVKNNKNVIGIGKIGDIFNHRGLTRDIKTKSNEDGINKTVQVINKTRKKDSLIFTNLVDFDSVYGHRRNVKGYAEALEYFDRRLEEIQKNMDSEDILFITADHGCDPTYGKHTDHTREYVPLLVYGDKVKTGVDLGVRKTFADCGQTIADIMGVEKLKLGKSFKNKILKSN